ncbi:MAG: hypothetical protein IIB77_04025 [Proteobacteria bacterium]|nr:hypothetical protein [Pseudomonadota bacterium]
MSWSDELTKIRRLLRDPDANIWTDNLILHLFNDMQKDFQHRTSVLEDAAVQRIPGVYHFAYMHDWEYQLLPTTLSVFYQCLAQHDEGVFCHRWEPQEVTGIAADVSDLGVHFTQPWEAYMGLLPGEVLKNRFPANMRNLKHIAYNEKPISRTTKKRVSMTDPSFIINEGEPIAYYEYDDLDHSYVLYPRPSASFADELDGLEGPAWFIEDDTEDVTAGTVAIRTGDFASDNVGAAFDIIGFKNNVFMIYDVDPVDMVSASDDGDYPDFLKKYIRYGVVSRAYGANTDGRIQSLSDYWDARYLAGVKVAKKFALNKNNDRDYRLLTRGAPVRRTKRHPRLPSTYPATNP